MSIDFGASPVTRRLLAGSDSTALRCMHGALSHSALQAHVDQRASTLVQCGVKRLASLGDNGLEWVIVDLAVLQAGIVHVPLPVFFTQQQRRNAIEVAGTDAVLVDPEYYQAGEWSGFALTLTTDAGWYLLQRSDQHVCLPPGTSKITFTSGSTGNPKGVCLSAAGLLNVAEGVAQATSSLHLTRHLNALPYAVLLENVAGLYAAVMQSVENISLPMSAMGLQGSSRFDPGRFHQTLCDWSVDSVIMLPQMLKAYVHWLSATGHRAADSLAYVAVGGAAIGPQWLVRAHQMGVPAYQGYGLSEGGSVQAVNLPGRNRLDSVGHLLPHAQVRFAPDSEILLRSPAFLGYAGQTATTQDWFPTGDLGYVDDEGFLHLSGRKKNLVITGYGRNVSPEWVETCLQDHVGIRAAVVLGDGQRELGAVVWPEDSDTPDDLISNAIAGANTSLPDYARVGRWVRARQAFSMEHGISTANGRPVRAAVERLYFDELFPVEQGDALGTDQPRVNRRFTILENS